MQAYSPIEAEEEARVYEPATLTKREGRRVRGLSPMSVVVPYIMETRNTSQNFIRESIDVSAIERYIREKQDAGMHGFGIMHVIITAYLRTVAARPALNRYIRGQRVWKRENVELVFVIKKEMTLESPDTTLKIPFNLTETAEDVYRVVEDKVTGYRREPGGDFDSFAKLLTVLPGLLFRWTIHLLRSLDYVNLLPRRLTKLSPFHGSLFITSMGSLGIPAIYHHLYDFGNVPVFCAFGAKRREFVVQRDGSVRRTPFVDLTFVTDERICDGYYFASALKYMRSLWRNPWLLDSPPDEIVADID